MQNMTAKVSLVRQKLNWKEKILEIKHKGKHSTKMSSKTQETHFCIFYIYFRASLSSRHSKNKNLQTDVAKSTEKWPLLLHVYKKWQ